MVISIHLKNASIITLNENDYSFNGKTGTSFKSDILIDNNVEKFALTEEAFELLEIGKTYDLTAELYFDSKRSSLRITGISK